jgi:hypothetical protein
LLVIVTIVVGLALAGIFAAYRASQRTLEATAATQAARDQLWQSYLAQATAGRLSTSPGRKGEGRHIIEAASRIRPSLQLRNESIAHMALLDVASDHQEEFPENNATLVCAPDLSQYALMDRALARGGVAAAAPGRPLPAGRLALTWFPGAALSNRFGITGRPAI